MVPKFKELDPNDPEIWTIIGNLISENTSTIQRLEKVIKSSTEQNVILIHSLKDFVRKLDSLKKRVAKLERGFE
jgi:hypothetical protein